MDLLGNLPGISSVFSLLGKSFSTKAFIIAALLPALVFALSAIPGQHSSD